MHDVQRRTGVDGQAGGATQGNAGPVGEIDGGKDDMRRKHIRMIRGLTAKSEG
jgi:hypothetical protein